MRGDANGIDTTVITDIRNYFEQELGVVIPHNYPLVGRNFNVTTISDSLPQSKHL